MIFPWFSSYFGSPAGHYTSTIVDFFIARIFPNFGEIYISVEGDIGIVIKHIFYRKIFDQYWGSNRTDVKNDQGRKHIAVQMVVDNAHVDGPWDRNKMEVLRISRVAVIHYMDSLLGFIDKNVLLIG